MKNILITVVLTLFVFNGLFAQLGGKVVYEVTLNVKQLNPNKSKFEPREAVLTFNGNTSLFSSPIEFNSVVLFNVIDTVREQKNMGMGVQYVMCPSSFYTDIASKQLISEERGVISSCSKSYTAENSGEVKWTIHNDKKKIGKYSCTKATGTFKGRVYEVWFAESLNVPFGPWKLNGLPGLILEATDNEGYVSFKYKSFKKDLKVKVDFSIPDSKDLLTPKELQQLKVAEVYKIHKVTASSSPSKLLKEYDFSCFLERE
jgi:GLPGLI family protein